MPSQKTGRPFADVDDDVPSRVRTVLLVGGNHANDFRGVQAEHFHDLFKRLRRDIAENVLHLLKNTRQMRFRTQAGNHPVNILVPLAFGDGGDHIRTKQKGIKEAEFFLFTVVKAPRGVFGESVVTLHLLCQAFDPDRDRGIAGGEQSPVGALVFDQVLHKAAMPDPVNRQRLKKVQGGLLKRLQGQDGILLLPVISGFPVEHLPAKGGVFRQGLGCARNRLIKAKTPRQPVDQQSDRIFFQYREGDRMISQRMTGMRQPHEVATSLGDQSQNGLVIGVPIMVPQCSKAGQLFGKIGTVSDGIEGEEFQDHFEHILLPPVDAGEVIVEQSQQMAGLIRSMQPPAFQKHLFSKTLGALRVLSKSHAQLTDTEPQGADGLSESGKVAGNPGIPWPTEVVMSLLMFSNPIIKGHVGGGNAEYVVRGCLSCHENSFP